VSDYLNKEAVSCDGFADPDRVGYPSESVLERMTGVLNRLANERGLMISLKANGSTVELRDGSLELFGLEAVAFFEGCLYGAEHGG
tara:strand:- start:2407 stop:2664 length:258 start_codon:yes stop_codon:yes gene_type:complete